MEKYINIFIFLALIAGIAGQIWSITRAQNRLEEWSRKNGLTIIRKEWRWLFRGPFTWNSGKGQIIYLVTFRTSDGNLRSGWVRCGSYWWGMLHTDIDVIWEDRHVQG